MKPCIGVVTLGVDDLERSLAVYRDGLGLPTKGITAGEFAGDETHPAGAIVMFHLESGLVLALYPRRELARDAGQAVGVASPTEFSLGYLAGSRDEVDRLLNDAQAAGATLADAAHDRPWGISSGYFKDPDGHLREVIWNPPR